MEHNALVNILKSLHDHEYSVEAALKKFRGLSFDDLGFARVDHHRGIRKGYPEVIFCQNKTTEHVLDITKNQIAHDETVFGTRANPETLDALTRNSRKSKSTGRGAVSGRNRRHGRKRTRSRETS